MKNPEKALTVILRIFAIVMLAALVPALMPFAWMDKIHTCLGMGKLPDIPITQYLTRSLSVMYVLQGALVIYLSFNINRNIWVIRYLITLFLLFGLGMLALDICIGMPGKWTLAEGPFVIILCLIILLIIKKIPT